MHNLKIFSFFLLAAVAGTLLHECGHAFMSLMFGYHPTIHYAYTDTMNDAEHAALRSGSTAFRQYPEWFWIMMGGPLQTTLTGLAGLCGLLVLNSRTQIDAWNTWHLLWIVLAYFFSREVFNGTFILYAIYTGSGLGSSDEVRLLRYAGWNITAWIWILWITSALVLAYITLVLVKRHRWQLMLLGGAGSIAGGVVWLYWLGEKIMP